MENLRQTNIKNRKTYFFNSFTNIKSFTNILIQAC